MASVQGFLQFFTSSLLVLLSIRSVSRAGRSCPGESRLPFRNFHEWCFAYVDDPMPWQQAREVCARMGSDLAKIENSAENGFAASLIFNEVSAWIGLSDRLKEGKYNWTDRTPMSYANWATREPNNYQDEDCVVMNPSSSWYDRQCWKSYSFICETPTVADCCPMDLPESLLADTNATTEGTTVKFRCAPGYYMSGSSNPTRVCQPNEVWSGVMPQCHSSPEETSNSERVSDDTSVTKPALKPSVRDWTPEQVEEWLNQSNLQQYTDYFKGYDGKVLIGMAQVRHEAPEYFFTNMGKLLQNPLDVMLLAEALDRLLK